MNIFTKKLFSKNSNYKLNENLLDGVFNQIKTNLKNIKEKNIKVVDYKSPEELKKLFPFELSDNKPSNDNEILNLTKKILDYSVHTTAHNYHNTLFGSFDETSLIGDYISTTLNGSIYTYELAPVFSLMEEEIARKFCQLLNWNKCDYMFAPGGSYANLYGVTTARAFKYPNFKKLGLKNLPQMKIFYSENGHYSFQKAGIICGFGLDNVIKVKCDKLGKMDIQELEKEVNKECNNKEVPLIVISTLGTTVLGAIDNITDIDKFCKKKGIWHHIDACFANGLLFLDNFLNKNPGIQNVDSISIDPHKVLPITQQCSIFLTKHQGILKQGNSTYASYLFMNDKIIYDSKFDKGDNSFQCGRHIDVLKIWLFWKYYSTQGIKQKILDLLDNVKYLVKLIKEHPNFHLIIEPEYSTVCFYYIPNRYLGENKNETLFKKLGMLAPQIKAEMVKKGNLMLSYQDLKFNEFLYPNFLRPSITVGKDKDDMEFMINEIHEIGKNL